MASAFHLLRGSMLLTAQRPITNFHPVEASGWDSAQSFFLG
jgi:hypothetical protein